VSARVVRPARARWSAPAASRARMRRDALRDALGVALGAALVVVVTSAAAAPLAAQTAVGDSLWRLGRLDEAAAAYRRALEEDRNAVRANFRVAQTLAWSQDIDSALVLLRAARARVPDDPDLLFTEATWLSWARRFGEAELRYDSLLAAHPGNDFNYVRIARARMFSWDGRLVDAARGYRDVLARDASDRDARFGLAQVRAWSGDLDGAAAAYARLLAEDPGEVRTLVALAQVRLWQQRTASAARLADRASARDSANGDVAELRKAIAAARAVRAEVGTFWSEDSDRNVNQWQTVGARAVVGDGLRLGATAGFLTATDPTRTSRRAMGEVSAGYPVLRGSVSAALGVRALDPAPLVAGSPVEGRTLFTGRLGVEQRVVPGLTVGASVARWPFDELAVLMPLALDVDQWEVTAAWRAPGGSGGRGRRHWSVRAARPLPRGFTAGAFATGFGYERRAPRYFSPPRFVAAELAAGWAHAGPRWTAGLDAGYGRQRIDTLATQDQWHLNARAGRQWGTRWAVELVGGRSTSAAASAVGAYAYTTLGLQLRRTF
jgi:tetratricopeptide (TPR) repeat protein